MFKIKFIPYYIALELTLKCNMRCIHCGSAAGNIRQDELSTEEWIKVCRDASKIGCKLITFLGGEPFLRKDWIEIANNIKDFGMNVSIITNGFAIDDKIVTQLKEIQPYTVAISIDGSIPGTHDTIRQVKGSYEKCLSSLELLTKNTIPTSIVTTVHKKNIKELPTMRDFLLNKKIAWQIQIADTMGRFPRKLHVSPEEFYSLGLFIASIRSQYSVDELPVTGAHCIGYNSQLLPNVTISPKWMGCQAGVTVLGIQSDGSVKGCLSLSDEFVEDNIREKSLIDIWTNPDGFAYNRKFNTSFLKDECSSCKYGKKCRGGCMGVSIAETGRPHADPYCFYLYEKKRELIKN
jgi:radical SAM protein with 4Fe4S-binding SPASM domain